MSAHVSISTNMSPCDCRIVCLGRRYVSIYSIYSIYTWGCTVHTLGGLTAAVDTPQLASDADTQMSSLSMAKDLVDFVFFIALEIFE